MTLTKIEKSRHAIIWLLFYSALMVIGISRAPSDRLIAELATQTSLFAVYIIFFYLLLFYAWFRWHVNKLRSIIYNLMVVLVLLPLYLLPGYLEVTYVGRGTLVLSNEIVSWGVVVILLEIVALGVYLQKYSIEKIKASSQKEVELARQREEMITQELAFYKSEFNTHITFNALSHIYAKVMDDPAVASPILMLSDILRYNLKVKANQEVPIEQEVSYLRTFIDLYNTLFPGLEIDFRTEGCFGEVTVLPRIFINFVENAIKHGVRNDPDHPIVVSLVVEQDIVFMVKNRKTLKDKGTISTLTGLKNTKQTLEVYYPGRYILDIEDTDHWYAVRLVIARHAPRPSLPRPEVSSKLEK